MLFSQNACVSTKIKYYKFSPDNPSGGMYVKNSDTPVLLFRFIDIRPVMLVRPSVQVLLIRRFNNENY